jgi:hypothetical protein
VLVRGDDHAGAAVITMHQLELRDRAFRMMVRAAKKSYERLSRLTAALSREQATYRRTHEAVAEYYKAHYKEDPK